MFELKTVLQCTCNLCAHQWTTRTHELPLACSSCGSKRWNLERARPPMAEQRAVAAKRRAAKVAPKPAAK